MTLGQGRTARQYGGIYSGPVVASRGILQGVLDGIQGYGFDTRNFLKFAEIGQPKAPIDEAELYAFTSGGLKAGTI